MRVRGEREEKDERRAMRYLGRKRKEGGWRGKNGSWG